jgi:tRNA A-37 threonylcarbamoyl transferase component Bud32
MNEFPRRFGPYVLLKPLARGGRGALYLALSGPEESAKLCVIKTVLPHLADKEYLQRFRDEAKVVVRLSHGNLVPVFDSGQVAGEIYLAMDYVEGKDLRATWNRCAKKGIAFPVDVAAHIVKELARGLNYAHGFGDIKLVHRDVSPPNVLLSYSGEVRLTDFGLASSTLKLEKTAPGIIYGKVSYMSPEQARGEVLDGRTDLYASGIILWELLTGRQLFASNKPPGAPKDGHTSEEIPRSARTLVMASSCIARKRSAKEAISARIALREGAAGSPTVTPAELRHDWPRSCADVPATIRGVANFSMTFTRRTSRRAHRARGAGASRASRTRRSTPWFRRRAGVTGRGVGDEVPRVRRRRCRVAEGIRPVAKARPRKGGAGRADTRARKLTGTDSGSRSRAGERGLPRRRRGPVATGAASR